MVLLKSLFLFLLLSLSLFAPAEPTWLKITEKEVTPSKAVFETWVEDIFNFSEVWFVRDAGPFLELLREAGLDENLISELFSTFDNEIKEELSGSVWSFYRMPRDPVDGVVTVSKELKARLPAPVLRRVYQDQYRRGFGPPAIFEKDRDRILGLLGDLKLTPQIQQHLLESMIHVNGQYVIPITPDIWPHLPVSYRRKKVTEFVGSYDPSKIGLSIKIELSENTNLDEIARTLSPQSPAPLKERLKNILAHSKHQTVEVPLQDLLSPFVRAVSDRYNTYGGPNCLNCSFNFNRDEEYFLDFEDDRATAEILKEEYVRLTHDQSPQVGDVMLYYNERRQLVHGASFITDNIVFTKNGHDKFRPYQFQWRNSMERLYFPDSKFERQIFRAKSKTLGCTWALTAKKAELD